MGVDFGDVIGIGAAPFTGGLSLAASPTVRGAVGGAIEDYQNSGQVRWDEPGYEMGPRQQIGGDRGVDWVADQGYAGMKQAGMGGSWALGQAMGAQDRGPMANEAQWLSDQEYGARNGDQAGSLQLSREAAMGMAPSEAAFMMQQGLDKASAQQAAQAGGARGAAALAQAQGNAASNVANMQQQAFSNAGQLRANEMAQARAQYGQQAGQMRAQDQQRLQMGNQMSQYNAGLNDSYGIGMAGSAATFGQTGQGWYKGANDAYAQQGQLNNSYDQVGSGAYNAQQDRRAGINTRNADLKQARGDKMVDAGLGLLKTGGQAALSQGK